MVLWGGGVRWQGHQADDELWPGHLQENPHRSACQHPHIWGVYILFCIKHSTSATVVF